MKLDAKCTWMAALLVVCVGGCAEAVSHDDVDGTDRITGDGEIAGTPAKGGEGEAAYAASSAPGASDGAGGPGAAAPSGGNGTIAAGVLTAGTWDDNRNFDLFLSYKSKVASSGPEGLLSFSLAENQAARAAALANRGPKQQLDVSLVIDTTGSMGDEIAYLQREFDALAGTIQAKYPNAEQHWSLVAYKDTTDEYIARWFDFRADTGEFRSKLAGQSAGGGGDTPEAPDQALAIAHRLSWRSAASTAKLMFWVADAPHHAENAPRMTDAIRGARDKGIHIYPVASSGIDESTELAMREAAQITGGRYVFLTDDSGVGSAHKEASVPCFFVTKLDKAILRMVDIEMTGAYREPAAEELVRTGGQPESGVCTLGSGETALIY